MSGDDHVPEPSARALPWYGRVALGSPRRHPWVFAAVAIATFAVPAAILPVLPRTYEVRCRLVLRSPSGWLPELDERAGAPPRAAAHKVRAAAELLGLVRETDLVARWRRLRPPLLRLKDRLLSSPASDGQLATSLAGTLETRLVATVSQEGVVDIEVRWSDPEVALDLARAAEQRYLALWQEDEVALMSRTVDVLQARTEEARLDVERRVGETRVTSGWGPRDFPPDEGGGVGRSRPGSQGGRPFGTGGPDRPRAPSPATGPRRTVRATIDVDTLLRMRALRLAVPFAPAPEDDTPVAAAVDVPQEEEEADDLRPRVLGAFGVLGALDRREGREARDGRGGAKLLESARTGAATAEQTYATLSERLETARVELDTSRAAFGRRYLVVVPPTAPREPLRPTRDDVLIAALLDAILVAFFATAVVELRALRSAASAGRDGVASASPDRRRTLAAVAKVGGLAVACVVGIFAGNGDLAIAVAPFGLALVGLAAWWLPAHETLPVLGFLCLTLENPSEAFGAGVWGSPVHVVGALFLQKINATIPIRSLVFSGLDVALVLLTAALLARRLRGDDRTLDRVPPARPASTAALVCIATIAVVWASGLARGGDFGNSLWQVFRVIYLPCVLLLFSAGLRGPADAGRLGKVLVSAALYRAVMSIWIRLQYPDVEAVPFTTIHADSMLFVDAIALVLANFLVRPRPRTFWTAVGVVPLVMWGMVANHRRIAWVELLAVLVFVFALAPWNSLKRRMVRGLVAALPFFLLYTAVGWSRPTGPFAPVGTIRSVVDSKTDTSTAWRDWENYNIAYTVRRNPLLGTGFGHEYEEVVLLPDISANYPLYRYAPHNSVLGLLAYAGILGFAGLWMVIPVGLLLAVRANRHAVEARDRVAALTAVGVIVAYLVHCYGDMGLGTWVSVFTVAPAIAIVGKIAVATGAWPLRLRPGDAGTPP